MSKRPSSPTGQDSRSQLPPAERTEILEEAGPFEDRWEDEIVPDEEFGEVIDASKEDDRLDETIADADIEVVDTEEAPAPPLRTYLPDRGLREGEVLEPDLATYPLLHAFVPTWPSLSFDILRDNAGAERRTYPMSCAIVAGTQSQDATANEVTVMRWEGLARTGGDDSDSEDEADEDPVMTFRAIPHKGGVNRIRARNLPMPLSAPPPVAPERYHVATFADTGRVHIFDVAPHLNSLLTPGVAVGTLSKEPLHTVTAHGGAEGFALAWDNPGAGSGSGGRLLSGDIHSKIFLTTLTESSISTTARPFRSHTSSVEDLQWSPSESTVFASCSADQSIRIWDVRVRDRKSAIGVSNAHDADVNVISWNTKTNYLLASGGDDGVVKVWDLRNFRGSKAPTAEPVASFGWHKGPITSIEWHPTEESCFAASGADNQITLWDLSVEEDNEERPNAEELRDVPPQLLFIHQGQTDIKELHWHPQLPGTVVSTASDGFNIFKTLPFSD